jgi:DNA-binding transcriptional LysR family regulator
MTVLPISDEPAVAELPSSEVDPNASNVSLKSLSGRLIMFRRADGPYLYDTTLAMFRREGMSPKIVEETPSSILATLALVAAGRGVALVPASIARNVSVAGVAYKPIGSGVVSTWPTALAHMPLAAKSPAGRILLAWKRRLRNVRTSGAFDLFCGDSPARSSRE